MLQFNTDDSPATVNHVIRLRDSAYAIDMFLAAVCELDFFSWLSRHPGTTRQICDGLSIARRPTDVMIRLFEAWGLVQVTDGLVEATDPSKTYLNAGSDKHILPYVTSLSGRISVKEMATLLHDDRPADWDPSLDSDVQDWASLMQDEAFAEDYIDAMDRRGALFAPCLTGLFSGEDTTTLLDVAGGSGIYTIHILQQFPDMTATLLDRSPVDTYAQRAFARAGLTARTRVVTRDMFVEPLPSGHDHHLYSHVMHNWPPDKVQLLIDKSFDALESGGRLTVFGSHLNDINRNRSGIPMAEYSVLLAFLYPGRCYGVDETMQMMTQAGFAETDWAKTDFDRSVITARKP